jgi:hypothetical protein
VLDIQSQAFVGKVGVNNTGRAPPPAQGAQATAGRDAATLPCSDYMCDGSTLVRGRHWLWRELASSFWHD